MSDLELPVRNARKFLSENFVVDTWENIETYLTELENRAIDSKEELVKWFQDRSELESVLSEDMGWRYIKMTCDTTDKEASENFNYFVQNISPKFAPISNELNKKAVASQFLEQIDQDGYPIMIRGMQKALEIFRNENVPIQTELQTLQQKFGQISGAMTVVDGGEEITLQQAAVMLQDTDRERRKAIYEQVSQRRLQDKGDLDKLFSELIELRNRVALNADFANYRDYKFASLGRFDYTPEDCFEMHKSIKSEVVPLLNEMAANRKDFLDVKNLYPYDKAVDVAGRQALKPFNTSLELIDKTIECFHRLDPFLGECLAIMKKMGHLDLDSRKGKAPGGYNYPLSEIGVPFIFMNATSTLRDMVTILHEGGHAVHSFLTRDLELNDFKHTPSEVAELASMSMELISMDHWDLFFENANELKRAKQEHLEQLIETLPWVATIDKFQHWIYTNPNHSLDQRKEAWEEIFTEFSDGITEWNGYEDARSYLWQKQLHLYEVPFYYIEYGMAQLGAIAVWKNYKSNSKAGLNGYMAALKLGYKKSIPEIFEAANIRFDFSKDYIHELMAFVKAELESLR